jgi:citrate lyase alpha subunit
MTRQTKVMPSLGEAIRQSGLRDGMTISFHHHLREGDRVLNSVLAECSVLQSKRQFNLDSHAASFQTKPAWVRHLTHTPSQAPIIPRSKASSR